MLRNKKNLFTFLLASLLCVSCFVGSLFVSGYNAHADEDENSPIVVSDDFSTAGGTGITNSHAFAYDHVTSDEAGGGHDVYGLIPASAWGANVDAGKGYIVYKIQSTNDEKGIANLKLKFNCYFGCCSIGEYCGENNTNLRVYYSKNNTSWTEAFNLHNGSSSTVPLTNVVTDANGQAYISNGNTNVFGNNSVYAEYTADFSNVVFNSSVVYVKFEFIHLTYDDMAGKVTEARLKDYDYDTVNKKVPLHRLGVFLQDVTVTADETALTDLTVYHDDVSIDFGDYTVGSSAWTNLVYDTEGLSIFSVADSNVFNAATCVIAPTNAQTDGYFVLKFSAPSGCTFGSAKLTSVARCFDYYAQNNGEKLDYYVSLDNDTYTLVYPSPIKSSTAYGMNTEVDFGDCVSGKTAFYVKVVIGRSSANADWTCIKKLSMDVELEKVKITVHCGDDYSVTLTQLKGTLLDLSGISEFFTRADDNIYATSETVNTDLFDATAPINTDVDVYLKGEWSAYTITYVLNGGQFNTDAPESYTSDVGCTLVSPEKTGYDFEGWFTDGTYKKQIKKIAVGRKEHLTLYAKWAPVQDDTGKTVHNGNIYVDFGIYSASSDAWAENAYETSGLSIRDGVDYNDSAIITPAIAPASTKSEGYIVYKFKAPNGRNFSSANLTSFARCFDFYCQGVYEKLDYYISFNNYDFTLVYSSPIKQSTSRGIITELDLGDYVFGKTAFYVKVVIGCSNDTSWTNLKELSVNVEFEDLDLTVDFGNGHVENVKHYRGETFNPSDITMPDGFVLDENVAYLSKDYSSDNVLSSTAPVLENTEIYLKGTWGCYSLNYNLDGGVCDDLPDRYYSSDGLTLPTPVKEGSVFVGWFTDDNYSEPITEIAKNQTGGFNLYAKWAANNPPTNIVPDDVVTGGGCNGSVDSVLTVGLTVTLLGFVLATKKLLKGEKEERR